MSAPCKLLFVCSRGQRRSFTAERIFSRDPHLSVRSAGTEPSARVRVGRALLAWADVLIVMESRHRARLRQRFPGEIDALERDGALIVLDIPDVYEAMDPDLQDVLRAAVAPILQGRRTTW